MNKNILQSIAESRRQRREEESRQVRDLTGGRRSFPVIPFFDDRGLICEIKRASPSRGMLIGNESIELIMEDYIASGVRRFSVLSEQQYFQGSCADIYRLKQRWRDRAFLRKDFLLTQDDITESYLIGADAVLLIAELLSEDQLKLLTRHARKVGLQVLTEVHSLPLALRILALPPHLQPDALGINSRNLEDFSVNTLLPFTAIAAPECKIPLVFESGIDHEYTAFLAGNAGFHSLLIGEACMTSSKNRRDVAASLASSYHRGASAEAVFLTRLMKRYRGRPLVKICGITSRKDAEAACELGADVIGMVLAPSKRQVPPSFLTEVSPVNMLRCAVVREPDGMLIRQLEEAVASGIIQGVQLHENTSPQLLSRFSGNAFNASTIDPGQPMPRRKSWEGPLVLYDLPKSRKAGTILDIPAASSLTKRCIAGGITPENAAKIVSEFSPLMIDVSSGVESSPGIKDRKKLESLFYQLEHIYG